MTASVWDLHLTQVQTQLEGIVTNPFVQYAEVRTKEDILAKAGVPLPADAKEVRRKFTLIYASHGGAVNLGELVVYANLDPLLTKLYEKIALIAAIQFLKTLLSTFLIYFVIQRILTRHLMDISYYLKKLDMNTSAIP